MPYQAGGGWRRSGVEQGTCLLPYCSVKTLYFYYISRCLPSILIELKTLLGSGDGEKPAQGGSEFRILSFLADLAVLAAWLFVAPLEETLDGTRMPGIVVGACHPSTWEAEAGD